MPRFQDPRFITSLKDARYWSLDWISEHNIQGPFHYVILLKTDGGFHVIGEYATATEAFAERRQLVAETGVRSYFLRAVRIGIAVQPGAPETREDLDRWRDALNSGHETLITPSELPQFRSWAARAIENRSAYQRVDRDAPRFVEQHGEIPF